MTPLFRRSLLAASVALVLSGCNVIAPYQQPKADLDAPLEQNTGWHLVSSAGQTTARQGGAAVSGAASSSKGDQPGGAAPSGRAGQAASAQDGAQGTDSGRNGESNTGQGAAGQRGTGQPASADASRIPAPLATVTLLNGAAFDDPVLTHLLARQQSGSLTLIQSEARIRQARAVLAGAGASRLPQVTANAGGTRQGTKASGSASSSLSSAMSGSGTAATGTTGSSGMSGMSGMSGGLGVSNTVQAGTSISWAPDLWGRVSAKVEGSRASLEAAEADRKAAELQAQVSLIQSYWRMRLAEARLVLLERSIATAERSLKLVRNQHASGLVARADVVQAETRLQTVLTQRHELVSSRDTERHAMAVLMGIPPSALTAEMLKPAAGSVLGRQIGSSGAAMPSASGAGSPEASGAGTLQTSGMPGAGSSSASGFRKTADASGTRKTVKPGTEGADGPDKASGQTAPPVQLPSVPALPETLSIDLLVRRPDVRATERAVAAANAELGIARSAWLPDLTFTASGTLGAETVANLISSPLRSWSVGTQLAGTLFDGGTRSSTLQQQEAAYDEKVAAYRESVLKALQEVEDGMLNFQTLRNQEADQRRLVELAQESERVVRNRYQSGLVNYLELSTAESTSLSAQDTLLSLQANRLNNYITLLSAVGGSWQVQ